MCNLGGETVGRVYSRTGRLGKEGVGAEGPEKRRRLPKTL